MNSLVLIRHGQSMWNLKNVFTGWVDVPLSSKGIFEAQEAGKKLADIKFQSIFTSVQVRAIETAMIAMAFNNDDKTPVIIHKNGKMKEYTHIYDTKMKNSIIPVYSDEHLNERYYGELQGLNKTETVLKYGDEQVHKWRRSYDVKPPKGESLEDTTARTIPFFEKEILDKLKRGENVLVSAHGNSLRSIVMYIEKLTNEEVTKLEIPTGQPIVYKFENNHFILK